MYTFIYSTTIMSLAKRKINLTKNQLNKLRIAHKKQRRAILTLRKDQLKNGKVDVMLDSNQNKLLDRAIRKNKGMRMDFDHYRLKEMIDGGLLKEIMTLAEDNIPYFRKLASPLIRNRVAPILKDQFVPWLKKLIDEELDTLMEKDSTGAGLVRRINSQLRRALHDAREVKKN